MKLVVTFLLMVPMAFASQGRLAQAEVQFDEQHYGEALALLRPLLARLGGFGPEQRQEIQALVAHCEFELGDYVAAKFHFKDLFDQTSLYRKVQISDRLGDFKGLRENYTKIKNPPDFIRYIYARQLFLNHQDDQAAAELQNLIHSDEFKDRANYILACILTRKGEYEKAQALFQTLVGNKEPQLATLSKLSVARLLYEQDKLDESIAIYETMTYPDELAIAQMRAGDLSADLKKAQRYYQQAEKNITRKNLKSRILLRQDKNEEASALFQTETNEILQLKKKIAENDPKLSSEPWIQAQPEIQRLAQVKNKIDSAEDKVLETEMAYDSVEIFMVGGFDTQAKRQELELAKSKIDVLRKDWSGLEQNYDKTYVAVTLDSKSVWTARLDALKREEDEALVHSGIREPLRLRKRIAQIEQTKAVELKRIEEEVQL